MEHGNSGEGKAGAQAVIDAYKAVDSFNPWNRDRALYKI
jgi:hypothetical protein